MRPCPAPQSGHFYDGTPTDYTSKSERAEILAIKKYTGINTYF